MEKFRITDFGTLEIRLLNDRILFSTTPDYQEVVADLSKEKALLIAEKICAWAYDIPDEPDRHMQYTACCGGEANVFMTIPYSRCRQNRSIKIHHNGRLYDAVLDIEKPRYRK